MLNKEALSAGREHTNPEAGTGLGLPLTKNLVEMHGGKLELVSAPDVGTTVTVRLPAERIVRPKGLVRSARATANA